MRDMGAVTPGAKSRRVHRLFWIEARSLSSGDAETFGFWDGLEPATFTIGGASRLYHGGGAVVQAPPIVAEVGLVERMHRIALGPFAPAIADAIALYDLTEAPIEVHSARFDPVSGALLGIVPDLFGRVRSFEITKDPAGRTASAELAFRGGVARLMRGVPLRKSDAALQAVHPGDAFRRHSAVAGVVQVQWGEGRAYRPGVTSVAVPSGPTAVEKEHG